MHFPFMLDSFQCFMNIVGRDVCKDDFVCNRFILARALLLGVTPVFLTTTDKIDNRIVGIVDLYI